MFCDNYTWTICCFVLLFDNSTEAHEGFIEIIFPVRLGNTLVSVVVIAQTWISEHNRTKNYEYSTVDSLLYFFILDNQIDNQRRQSKLFQVVMSQNKK